LSDPSWPIAFPNLTTLHVEFFLDFPEVFRSILKYILTRLASLVHLNLYSNEDMKSTENVYIANSAWDCWDLLTGGAPTLLQKSNLSHLELVQELGELEEPVNGVYQIASLRNMRSKSRKSSFNSTKKYYKSSHLFHVLIELFKTLFILNFKV